MSNPQTTKIYWAGFSEGKLYEEAVNDMWGNEETFHLAPSLFKIKAEAKKRFEDVRKVKIVEVK